MVVTCCPTANTAAESHFALQFATRVRNITLAPAMRQVADARNLEENFRAIKSELKQAQQDKARLQLEKDNLGMDSSKQQQRMTANLDARVRSMLDAQVAVERELSMMQRREQELLNSLEAREAQAEQHGRVISTLKQVRSASVQRLLSVR